MYEVCEVRASHHHIWLPSLGKSDPDSSRDEAPGYRPFRGIPSSQKLSWQPRLHNERFWPWETFPMHLCRNRNSRLSHFRWSLLQISQGALFSRCCFMSISFRRWILWWGIRWDETLHYTMWAREPWVNAWLQDISALWWEDRKLAGIAKRGRTAKLWINYHTQVLTIKNFI